jgi:anaphase-promoting complex subunit 3
MNATRPLSSADESGPVTKKLRSSSRQRTQTSKPAINGDETSKKLAPLRVTQTTKGSTLNSVIATRRSSRLQHAPGTKQPPLAKTRERRRIPSKIPSRSVESEGDDEGEAAASSSLTSAPQSPNSDASIAPSNLTALPDHASQEAHETEVAEHYLYELMRRFAAATRALSRYESQTCLDELSQLPFIYQQSVSVLVMVGRAEFERQDYEAALRAFQAVRTLDPHRVLDMEVYSTLLWHLQNRVQLSFLGQELFNINPRAAQAWIAVGNLFSLEKERSQALTCFRRAFQMEPSCAYAYTLSGHECVEDDLTQAIHFFQSALRVDPRHYNAWYGLGTCYLRQSKLRLAEYHYRKALDIHPNNAILLGCVGIVSRYSFWVPTASL